MGGGRDQQGWRTSPLTHRTARARSKAPASTPASEKNSASADSANLLGHVSGDVAPMFEVPVLSSDRHASVVQAIAVR
jgi:hypothetical protein